jgi:hypothetical protein
MLLRPRKVPQGDLIGSLLQNTPGTTEGRGQRPYTHVQKYARAYQLCAANKKGPQSIGGLKIILQGPALGQPRLADRAGPWVCACGAF